MLPPMTTEYRLTFFDESGKIIEIDETDSFETIREMANNNPHAWRFTIESSKRLFTTNSRRALLHGLETMPW